MTEEITEDQLEELAELCENRKKVNEKYRELKNRRSELDEKIAQLAPTKDEGSKTSTFELPDGRTLKITTKTRVYRDIDGETWDRIKEEIPGELREVIREERKLKIDKKGFRWIRDNRPDVFGQLSEAISSRTGKPGITIKELE